MKETLEKYLKRVYSEQNEMQERGEAGVSERNSSITKNKNMVILEFPKNIQIDSLITPYGLGISGDMSNANKIKMTAYDSTGKKVLDKKSFTNMSPDVFADFDEEATLVLKQGSREITFNVPVAGFTYSRTAPAAFKKALNKNKRKEITKGEE